MPMPTWRNNSGLLLFLLVLAHASAGSPKSVGNWRLDWNIYFDAEYFYMTEMPMLIPMLMPDGTSLPFSAWQGLTPEMRPRRMALLRMQMEELGMRMDRIIEVEEQTFMVMSMNPVSVLEQSRGNLLLNLEKSKHRLHLNFQARRLLTTEGKAQAELAERDVHLGILELYYQYSSSDAFSIRVGKFLPPFGIFNDVRYISPLFAPVVLPELLAPQPNYAQGEHYRDPPPANGNLMVNGTFFGERWTEWGYALYVGSGKFEPEHLDSSEENAIGARLFGTFKDNLELGFSWYTISQEEESVSDRENLYGIDLQYRFLDERLILQAEYLLGDVTTREDRIASYARLTYEYHHWRPFIMLDRFQDKADPLFRKRMNRWGMGCGYQLGNHLTLKLEYHNHTFSDKADLPLDADPTHMIRSAIIVAW